MRVLLLANAYPSAEHPSFGVYVARAEAALRAQGHVVDRAVLRTRARGPLRTPLKYTWLAADGGVHALARRPDVIWAHYLVPTGAIARRIGRTLRVPYVVTAHGSDVANAEAGGRLLDATRRTVRDAAAVICVSADLAARLDAACGPLAVPPAVVSAGVDLSRFHDGDREVAAAALGWDAPSPRIVYVGNLVEVKNLERLVDAFARVHARSGGSLALVGAGPLAPALRAQAAALGLGDALRLVGEVAPDVVPRWLRAADASALVSLREGFGLAAIEALACGRAVALTSAAGVAPAVEPGVTGALCDPADVDSIADALGQAAALRPGSAAVAAAAPYALDAETARVAEILERASRARG